jgi:hypothetical protein
LLAVACTIVWQDKRKLPLLFAAGALAGATTCFLQPKGILLLFALLVWLWMQHRRSPASLSWLRALAGGYISVVALMLFYFWSRHALWDLFYDNVIWPSKHYGTLNVVPYAHGLIQFYWDRFVIAESGFRWTVVTASILTVPFFFVAALPLLLPALAARWVRNSVRPEIVLYWLSGVALWLSELHRSDICHLVFGSPLLVILCVYYLQQYRAKMAELALQILAITATFLACFNLLLTLFAHSVATRAGPVALFKPNPALAFVQGKADAGEEIFAYPYCAMYYFLSGTVNPTRYAALLYNFNTPSQFEEVVTDLEQRRVRYVVWNTGFEKSAQISFPNMRKVRDDQLILEPYLQSHYKVIWSDADNEVMERKGENAAEESAMHLVEH